MFEVVGAIAAILVALAAIGQLILKYREHRATFFPKRGDGDSQ